MPKHTIHTHVLGFPRVGAERELKFALERHWRGDATAAELEHVGRTLRARHWALQRDAGLDLVSVGDFAFYDQTANHIQLFGCEPARFGFDAPGAATTTPLQRYFTMARGDTEHSACNHAHAEAAPSSDAGHGGETGHALDMTKWFDTNYHYLVPEFTAQTAFSLHAERLLGEVAEAQALGHAVKAVLLGPLTFLWLGKERQADADGTAAAPFSRLDLLDTLLAQYSALLGALKQRGVSWVQIDEPILGLDLPPAWRNAFDSAYWQLNQAGINVLLATYFSPLEENLSLACRLPVAGLHVDGVRAAHELTSVCDWLPSHKVLSVGIVDGRNIWRTDLDRALAVLRPLLAKRDNSLWLAPSCSLLHVPFSLANETALDPEMRSWLAFASEKLAELALLKGALDGSASSDASDANPGSDNSNSSASSATSATSADPLAPSRAALASRRHSARVHNPAVARRLAALAPDADRRRSPFAQRQALQQARFQLPAYPTTTIGSFPQTAAIRAARAAFKRGELDAESYAARMRAEIDDAVARQEALGLDVLVHGEAERNDMVEYFGEQLDGYAFTQFGWVQSYGSRCVKPPLLYGDVTRPRPMTVAWTCYAQSRTKLPLKGMLTGPVTMLQWSFVRDDQPRAATMLQIALAMRDEVAGLEQAGIGIIQIDEPAIREGLPLRRSQWHAYLAGATRAFRIAASAVTDATQIHTHMCYSEFNDILPQIASMDADVITIETSRSDMALLDGFGQFRYPNQIGPGVYDIHSPRVPATSDMLRLLRKASAVIPAAQLWVNPDCGLKTRGWAETEAALANMVAAARLMRAA